MLSSPVTTAAAPASTVAAAETATAVEIIDQCIDSRHSNYHVQPAGCVHAHERVRERDVRRSEEESVTCVTDSLVRLEMF